MNPRDPRLQELDESIEDRADAAIQKARDELVQALGREFGLKYASPGMMAIINTLGASLRDIYEGRDLQRAQAVHAPRGTYQDEPEREPKTDPMGLRAPQTGRTTPGMPSTNPPPPRRPPPLPHDARRKRGS